MKEINTIDNDRKKEQRTYIVEDYEYKIIILWLLSPFGWDRATGVSCLNPYKIKILQYNI